jgi:6-phosphogluconolactonase
MNALAAPHARMTLNLAALLDARRIILHFEGQAKWQVYHRARTPGPRPNCRSAPSCIRRRLR